LAGNLARADIAEYDVALDARRAGLALYVSVIPIIDEIGEKINSHAMSDTPPLTIGLPVYNSKRYLACSLDSLLSQTYGDYRLIISDNASTDGTSDICQDYASRDKRITYHRNSVNIGASPNFNRVFALSDSPYFKWATADDYWAPTMIEKCMKVVESDPTIALCYPQATLVDAGGGNPERYDDALHLMDDSPRERFIQLMERIRLSHQHLGVSRSSMLKRTQMLGAHVGSDINLLAELALYGKFYELPERLFFRRLHEDSGSWARNSDEHQARRYYAAASSRMALVTWRQHYAFFRAVSRAPLKLSDRLSLYRYLGRRLRWDRVRLAKELWAKASGLVVK
jgi:glycosyltransferase involved in cell wall biosynthesis